MLINRSSKFEEASVRCTLSIDAFSITTITPYCKKRYIDGDKNNCFLFLIIPLEKKHKVFPVFLYQSPDGMSDELTNEYIDRIIEASKDTKFKLRGNLDDDQQFKDHSKKIENKFFSNFLVKTAWFSIKFKFKLEYIKITSILAHLDSFLSSNININ